MLFGKVFLPPNIVPSHVQYIVILYSLKSLAYLVSHLSQIMVPCRQLYHCCLGAKNGSWWLCQKDHMSHSVTEFLSALFIYTTNHKTWFDYKLHNKWINPYIHVAFVRAHRDKYALISMDKWDYFLNITYMCLECRKKLQKYALLWWNKTFAPRTRLENVHVWPAEGSKGLKKKKLTTWRFTALPKCRT